MVRSVGGGSCGCCGREGPSGERGETSSAMCLRGQRRLRFGRPLLLGLGRGRRCPCRSSLLGGGRTYDIGLGLCISI